MDLLYGTAFLEEAPDAYQRLLLDLMLGDPTLFIRADEVGRSWRIVDPVLGDAVPVHQYTRGSWGPKEADTLLPDGTVLTTAPEEGRATISPATTQARAAFCARCSSVRRPSRASRATSSGS